MSEHDLALEELKALVAVPGSLRIITNEIVDDLKDVGRLRRNGVLFERDVEPVEWVVRNHPDREVRREWCRLPLRPDLDQNLLKKPSTFVIHPVVAIEGPDAKGRVTARSAEGDATYGYPANVLKRLQEWRNG